MPVKFVRLGGRARPVKFGFNALIEFGELTSRTLDQINNLNIHSFTLKDLILICWCGLKQGARIEKQEFDATLEDVGDWFDENPEAMVEITTEYVKSKTPDQGNPALQKKTGKRSP